MTTINWSSDSHSFLISTSTHKETKAEKLKKELEQNINIEKRIAEASYRDIITGYGNFEKFKVDAQTILMIIRIPIMLCSTSTSRTSNTSTRPMDTT